MDLHHHSLIFFHGVNTDKFNSFIFTLSINVQQLAPVSCLRFQTKLRNYRSGDKSNHTNYTEV